MEAPTSLICTLCSQKFVGKQQFVAHFKQTHDAELKKRKKQNEDFAEWEWFVWELPSKFVARNGVPVPLWVAKQEKQSFRCPEGSCGASFPDLEGVLAHLKAHTLVCPACGDRQTSTELMTRHIETTHIRSKDAGKAADRDVTEVDFLSAFVEGVAMLQTDS